MIKVKELTMTSLVSDTREHGQTFQSTLLRHGCHLMSALALTIAIIAVHGCQDAHTPATAAQKPAAPPPPQVLVSLPVEKELAETREYTGHLEPVEAVSIRARVRGILEKVHFQEGVEVEKGALLYEIDPSEYQAVVDERSAEITRLEHQVKLAQSEAQRSTELYEKTATSKETWESKQTGLAVAEADLKKARASLKQAELNLSYTKIYAPISGRVGRTEMTEGNLVGHNEPTLLTSIVKMDPIYVNFEIPERDLLRFSAVSAEQSGHWTLMKAPFSIGLESEEGFPHEGFINFRDNEVESETGTVLLRGTLPNPDRLLVPGLFARIRIPVGKPQTRLLIPETALAAEQRGRYVLVVGPDNVVEQRLVKLETNLEGNGYLAINSGVNPGDQVIVSGIQRARPGAKVTPQVIDPDRVINLSVPVVATQK